MAGAAEVEHFLVRERRAVMWLETCLGRRLRSPELQAGLVDGLALCDVVNVLHAGAVKESKVDRSAPGTPSPANLNAFLKAARKRLGLNDATAFGVNDLLEARNMPAVLTTVETLAAKGAKIKSSFALPDVRVSDLNLTDAERDRGAALLTADGADPHHLGVPGGSGTGGGSGGGNVLGGSSSSSSSSSFSGFSSDSPKEKDGESGSRPAADRKARRNGRTAKNGGKRKDQKHQRGKGGEAVAALTEQDLRRHDGTVEFDVTNDRGELQSSAVYRAGMRGRVSPTSSISSSTTASATASQTEEVNRWKQQYENLEMSDLNALKEMFGVDTRPLSDTQSNAGDDDIVSPVSGGSGGAGDRGGNGNGNGRPRSGKGAPGNGMNSRQTRRHRRGNSRDGQIASADPPAQAAGNGRSPSSGRPYAPVSPKQSFDPPSGLPSDAGDGLLPPPASGRLPGYTGRSGSRGSDPPPASWADIRDDDPSAAAAAGAPPSSSRLRGSGSSKDDLVAGSGEHPLVLINEMLTEVVSLLSDENEEIRRRIEEHTQAGTLDKLASEHHILSLRTTLEYALGYLTGSASSGETHNASASSEGGSRPASRGGGKGSGSAGGGGGGGGGGSSGKSPSRRGRKKRKSKDKGKIVASEGGGDGAAGDAQSKHRQRVEEHSGRILAAGKGVFNVVIRGSKVEAGILKIKRRNIKIMLCKGNSVRPHTTVTVYNEEYVKGSAKPNFRVMFHPTNALLILLDFGGRKKIILECENTLDRDVIHRTIQLFVSALTGGGVGSAGARSSEA